MHQGQPDPGEEPSQTIMADHSDASHITLEQISYPGSELEKR